MALNPTLASDLLAAAQACAGEVRAVVRAAAHRMGGPLPVKANRPDVPTEGTVAANDGVDRDKPFQRGTFNEQGAQTGTDKDGNPIYALVAAKGLTWAQVWNRIPAAVQAALRFLLRRCKVWVEVHDARTTDLSDLTKTGMVLRIAIKDAGGKEWRLARGFGIASAETHGWREVTP